MSEPTLDQVRRFWNANPVAAAAIPFERGSREYFQEFDRLRGELESPAFLAWFHSFAQFGGRSVLDVGCGNGFVLSRYAQAGARVYGVDLTEEAVTLSRKRFGFAGLRGHFSIGSCEQLPYRAGSFDCVSSTGVIHHTPHPERAIEEIRRVLRKGGLLTLMVYHRNSFARRVRMVIEHHTTGQSYQQLLNAVDGAGNPKGIAYSRRELRRMLSGFRIIDMRAGLVRLQDVHVYSDRPKLLRLLRLFERRFGWLLYARAIRR